MQDSMGEPACVKPPKPILDNVPVFYIGSLIRPLELLTQQVDLVCLHLPVCLLVSAQVKVLSQDFKHPVDRIKKSGLEYILCKHMS